MLKASNIDNGKNTNRRQSKKKDTTLKNKKNKKKDTTLFLNIKEVLIHCHEAAILHCSLKYSSK